MREGYRYPARISPDIEHLHHHRWDLLEERGEERRGEERRGEERRGEQRRGEERGEVRSGSRGKRLGVRGGEGERGVRGTSCCETKKIGRKKKKKRRKRKLRQDSRLPGYPHLFIDLTMIECD